MGSKISVRTGIRAGLGLLLALAACACEPGAESPAGAADAANGVGDSPGDAGGAAGDDAERSAGTDGAVRPVDDRNVCVVPSSRQPQMGHCRWDGGALRCAFHEVDKTTYDAFGRTCCVDDLARGAAVAEAPFDLGLELPAYSFLRRLFVGHVGVDGWHVVTDVHEGGVSVPALRLSLWRSAAPGSCALERANAAPFVAPNPLFVDPIGGGGAAAADGLWVAGAGVQGTSVDVGAPSPAWGAGATVIEGCEPERLHRCEALEGATWHASIAACGGSIIAARSGDGRAFEAAPIAVDGLTAAALAEDVSCVTAGDALYVAWTEVADGQQAFRFNEVRDEAGAWDAPAFVTSPVILSLPLANPGARSRLTRFRPDDGRYWVAIAERLGAGEAQSGAVVWFGRSDDGQRWTFDEDRSCPSRACEIPDVVPLADGYFYVLSQEDAADPTARIIRFRYNVADGDPRAPVDVGRTIRGTSSVDGEGSASHASLQVSGDVVGYTYWQDWNVVDPLDPAAPPARLRLQRFRLER